MNGREMPGGMRKVFSVIFLCVAIAFVISVLDAGITRSSLAKKPAEIMGWIIEKKMYHSKTGYKYYFKYNFNIDDKEYHRKWLFGLVNKGTTVTKKEYEQYDIGSDVKILYSEQNPSINRLKEIGFDKSYLIWQILGIVVFGGIGVNEMKNFIKNGKSG